MNISLRRLLVLLTVFVLAFLAVFVIRKLQSGANLLDLVTGLTPEKNQENASYTLRAKPSVDLDDVQVLAAINEESAALVRAVVPSVVSIDTSGVRHRYFRDVWGRNWIQPQTVQGQGSGVIVTQEGHVLTNHHVIQGTPQIRLTMHDGTVHAATIIGTDPTVDIAVLKIDASGPFQALKFGDSSEVEVGNSVFAIGSPFGLGTSVTDGKISAKKRPLTDSQVDLLQTSAPINPGNSGGPLVNIRGEIVGINSRIYSTDRENPAFQGIGFAIPSNTALKTMKDILGLGHPTRGYLGMALENVDPYLREKTGYNMSGGVHVLALAPDSPATKAGLREGDIIVRFNSKDVPDVNRLIAMVQQSPAGTEVTLEVWREKSLQKIKAVIGETVSPKSDTTQPAPGQPATRLDTDTILQTIGVDVRDASDLEMSRGIRGVIVQRISPRSPLKGKVITGDEIIAINGRRLRDSADFFARLAISMPIQASELFVRRGRLTFRVPLSRLQSR